MADARGAIAIVLNGQSGALADTTNAETQNAAAILFEGERRIVTGFEELAAKGKNRRGTMRLDAERTTTVGAQ